MAILRAPNLEGAGFEHHGFTLRREGTSEGHYASLNLAFGVGDEGDRVRDNLALLQEKAGRGTALARLVQVHGADAVLAEECLLSDWQAEPKVEGDAVIVTAPNTTAAVQTADCAPVLLADPETRMVAAVHVGWRGAAKGVLRNTARRMRELGASTGNLLAAVGPTICGKCYEVGEDVARRFPESCFPKRNEPGKFLLDLPYAVEVSLIAAGISTPNIHRVDRCTCCEADAFFSHRRSEGKCGRMLGFIGLSD